MKRTKVRAAARIDIQMHADRIGQANAAAGRRFLVAVRAALDRLNEFPGLGTLAEFEEADFAGLRFWPVVGFDNYIIFYYETQTGIDVIRVIHGAQDLQGVLKRKF